MMINPIVAVITDNNGTCGAILHYTIASIFIAGAGFWFLSLWRRGRLDMDEGPKLQMMTIDEHYPVQPENHQTGTSADD